MFHDKNMTHKPYVFSSTETDQNAMPWIAEGKVKWFDPDRGFGFVRCDGLDQDVLLHSNVLITFGQSSASNDSAIRIRVRQCPRGLQAVEVLSLDAPEPDEHPVHGRDLGDLVQEVDDSVPYLPARVKWFDRAKGFGFANVFREEGDVFLHHSVLHRCGLVDLDMGEAICLRSVDGRNGRVAVEVQQWSFPKS